MLPRFFATLNNTSSSLRSSDELMRACPNNDKIVSRSISFPYIFSLIFTFISQPAIQTITNENNNERHKPGTPTHKKSG